MPLNWRLESMVVYKYLHCCWPQLCCHSVSLWTWPQILSSGFAILFESSISTTFLAQAERFCTATRASAVTCHRPWANYLTSEGQFPHPQLWIKIPTWDVAANLRSIMSSSLYDFFSNKVYYFLYLQVWIFNIFLMHEKHLAQCLAHRWYCVNGSHFYCYHY